MVKAMKEVLQCGADLSIEERNLLSVAYKNVVGARRSSWRVITSIEQKHDDDPKMAIVKRVREGIEEELQAICEEILNLLHNVLIPAAQSAESKIFFLKMYVTFYLLTFVFSGRVIIAATLPSSAPVTNAKRLLRTVLLLTNRLQRLPRRKCQPQILFVLVLLSTFLSFTMKL